MKVTFLALLLAAPASAQPVAISVDTSTTFAPLLGEVAESYRSSHPDVSVNVQSTGSIAAINGVAAGTTNVAFVDSSPPAGSPLIAQRVFAIPLAVVVNPSTGVTALTRAQVAGLFAGGYTSWKELGGNDLPIRPFIRPAQSAMSLAFAQVFGAMPRSGEALLGSSEVVDAVRSTPGGLGFTTLSAARSANVPIATIDGHDAAGSLGASGYPFYAVGYAVTNGPPIPMLSRFLAFVETRRPLMHKYGIVSVRDLR